MEKISTSKNFVNGMEGIIPLKNDSPYKKIFVVADIHGCFDKLMSLWKKLEVTDNDLVIFLGDYIDRGAQVAETIKWILEQSKRENFIFLRGNHEQMMLDTFQKRMDKITWLFNGGQTTIRGLSKLKAEDKIFIEQFLNFVENLPLSYSIEIGERTFFFCHAGVDSSKPLEEQTEDFLLWAREEFFDTYDGEAVIIGGHSPVQAFKRFGVADNPRPVKLPDRNILLMDTGSFIRSGKISAVDILTGEYCQSDSI
ncbi:MAG: serine/threonine protein phosphatase [Selenomonadaceae bacterium]|nr:serine/threonine protein phosphatase [Selenomonadaceae bacterium]